MAAEEDTGVEEGGVPEHAVVNEDTSRRGFRKVLSGKFATFIVRIAALLACMLVTLSLFQHSLIHHPHRYSLKTLMGLAQNAGVRIWPSYESYTGLLAGPSGVRAKGTVVVFHGNAGSALDRTHYLERFLPLGYRVILLEYPGYGAREGGLDEKNLITEGVRSVRLAQEQFGKPIYLMGESLGCAVAAGVTSLLADQIAGVLLITPWDNLPRVAQSIYWFFPVKFFVREHFDSVKNLKDFPGPLAVVMAEKDEIIPTASSLNLYHSFHGKKRLWTVTGAGHNSWYGLTDAEWWATVMSFIEN